MNPPSVMEIVQFKLHPELSRKEFLSSMEISESCLEACEGFKGRKLLYSDNQQIWVDLVEWDSLHHAHQAMESIAKRPELEILFHRLTNVAIHHLAHLPELDVKRKQAVSSLDPQPVYELLFYRLNEEADPAVYREHLIRLGNVALKYNGFLSRRVHQDQETGMWAEILQYRNMESADAMAGPFMAEAEMQPVFSMIDKTSVAMLFASEVAIGANV